MKSIYFTEWDSYQSISYMVMKFHHSTVLYFCEGRKPVKISQIWIHPTLRSPSSLTYAVNTLRPTLKGHQFKDIFKYILLYFDGVSLESVLILSLINNKSALGQVMAWHQTGHKPLYEQRLTKI